MQEGMTEDIANCEHEPIHALGSIQPHGALLCFLASGVLLAQSAGAERHLGALPPLGACLSDVHLDAVSRQAVHDALASPGATRDAIECMTPTGERYDLVIHWSGDILMAEWEHIDGNSLSTGHYAVLAQRAIQRLQEADHDTIEALLQGAVEAVRAMTGFDRVMGYRFLQDDSGEVVAEAKRDDLSPFLQQRYPAADIPAQARRLYVLHPIRQIVSINAEPVPIVPQVRSDNGQPYDLSHAILRSVSPVHIEYLKNMGVGASMSISIVINQRLWGLIACHHIAEYRASLAVRLSCTVLTQVLSILIERIVFKQRMADEQRTRVLGRQIAARLADASDLGKGLAAATEDVTKLVDCDAVGIIVEQRVVYSNGVADTAGLIALSELMSSQQRDVVVAASIAAAFPGMPRPRTATGEAAGLMAIQISSEARMTVVWLRDELVETIRWAGPPGKVIALGPNGPRLTPRGSFEVWKQTVRGSSREWSEADHEAARALRNVFQDVAIERLRENDRERMTLLATLGHDLRDPLQAITIAMQLMGHGLATSSDTARRVEGSTRRMQSLISYILDVSRIRSGIGLSMALQPTSLDKVLRTTVDDLRYSYPGVEVVLESEVLGEVSLDEDRFVQGLSNLLSNARQHGDPKAPIVIRGLTSRKSGADQGCETRIEVCNRTEKRPTVAFQRLIDPFKGGPMNLNNPTGLGLGLYIANAIFTGHGAAFDASFAENEACFSVTFPQHAAG